jgi:hypothetical protein
LMVNSTALPACRAALVTSSVATSWAWSIVSSPAPAGPSSSATTRRAAGALDSSGASRTILTDGFVPPSGRRNTGLTRFADAPSTRIGSALSALGPTRVAMSAGWPAFSNRCGSELRAARMTSCGRHVTDGSFAGGVVVRVVERGVRRR